MKASQMVVKRHEPPGAVRGNNQTACAMPLVSNTMRYSPSKYFFTNMTVA